MPSPVFRPLSALLSGLEKSPPVRGKRYVVWLEELVTKKWLASKTNPTGPEPQSGAPVTKSVAPVRGGLKLINASAAELARTVRRPTATTTARPRVRGAMWTKLLRRTPVND